MSFGFYFFFTDLPLYFVVAATINFVLVSMLWLTSTFLHAIKNFNAFIFTFAVGMIVAFVAGSFLSTHNGALGMLWGFNVGLFIIVFVTIGIGISQYHNDIESPLSFIYYFKKYWDLALSGIIYYMAIWIDKWIMWFAGDNVSTARNVVFNPIYDFPMFLAYLSLIPALSVFMLHTETGFLKHYHLFYREIEAHASYSWLHDRCQRMVDCLLAGLKDIAILQASLTLCAISLAPLIIELFGGEFRQVSIFRLGLIAAFFHMIFIFVTTQLYYFDLRKLNVCLHMLFLLTNGLFSYVTAVAGFPYYGYGYFASSLLSCVLSLIILSNVLKRLPYITFVSNNPSVL